mgnify:CR=1 FL=1
MLFLLYLNLLLNLFHIDNSLNDELIRFLNKNLPKKTIYSISCLSTTKNDFLVKINSDIPMIPASTNKLFTTGIALLNLGLDETIDTELYTDDENIEDDIINGNLYLKGHGDPTITTNELLELVNKLKIEGIKGITGNLIVDDTFFEETFYRNEWIEDENITVPLPPISALTVNNNTIIATLKGSSKINQPASIIIQEPLEYFKIINKTKTSRRKSRISASSEFEDGKEVITIQGNLKRNSVYNLKIFISNPSMYAAHLLVKLIKENGIIFNGEIKKGTLKKFSNRICSINKPIKDLIKPINKNSNNFYAEHLFIILGAFYAKSNGSPFDASQAINTYLKSINIYNPSINLVDGSGLSRKNQFSTETLVNFLYHIYLNPLVFDEFYKSLSIPQADGTLRHRFSNLNPPDRLRGKTGTLNGVVSLAGYVTSKSGDLLIFAINFNYTKGNQLKMRELQERIITKIAESF